MGIHGSYPAGTARTGSRISPKSAVGSMFRGRVGCGEHARIDFLASVPPLTLFLLMICARGPRNWAALRCANGRAIAALVPCWGLRATRCVS